MIRTLARFNVRGERRDGRIGVWVVNPGGPDGREDKIAAIGVRVRHWVSYHGVALNVDPDLDHFRGIVPCGVTDHGVTSLARHGITASMPEVDIALRATFGEAFAEAAVCAPPTLSRASGEG
jgi:lipoyl(octanoyl) transferase